MRIANIKKDWNKLDEGVRIKFKSRSMIHPDATYEGVIVNKYDNYLLVKGSPIVGTMEEKIVCNPRPYNFCIPKNLSYDEKFMIEEEDLYRAREKAS